PALPRHARCGDQPDPGEDGDEVARPRDRRDAPADVPDGLGRRGEGAADARELRAAQDLKPCSKGTARLARLLLVCLVVGCSKVSREDAEIQQAAKAQAEVIQNALIKGDFGTVADLTHPKAIEKIGGREKMLATITAGLDEMKAEGIAFKSVKMLD